MQANVVVIGGGPSGLMASAAAGMHGARVTLVDKGNKLGRKLAISGGGRCNVTNNKEIAELIKNLPGNGRFLYSVFNTFNNRDIIAFFEKLDVKLKEEDNGRMFPVSNSAKSVVEALLSKIRSVGVQIRTNTEIAQVLYQENRVIGVECTSGEQIKADAVIIASGGKSVPQTGSTGDGYPWAEAAGHTITELFPTEVPLTSSISLIRDKTLQGLSLRDVVLSVHNPKGKKLISHRGDMIFTHFGLSGPIALRCSQFVIKGLKKFKTNTIAVHLDMFPDQSADELKQQLHKAIQAQPKKSVKNLLKGFVPERMALVLANTISVSPDSETGKLTSVQLDKLSRLMKSFVIDVNGTLSLEKAFVTGGGVHLKEIQPKTLESKFTAGLYFCGEVLDIHGYTGGYNITAALCTGYVAGKSAAERIKV